MSPTPVPLLPYFRRAWQLTVQTQSGNKLIVSNTLGDLRVTFTVETYMLMVYWIATISISNIGRETGNQIQGSTNVAEFLRAGEPLKMGDSVTLSAGYLTTSGPGSTGDFNPGSDKIYQGTILQSWWSRDNVVDLQLNLRCALGLFQDFLGFASASIPAGVSDFSALQQICAPNQASITINADAASQELMSQTTQSRGQAFHGKPYDIVNQITEQYKGRIFPWVDTAGTLNLRVFDPNNIPVPAFSYGPPNPAAYTPQGVSQAGIKTTLLGSPQQTQDGVLFRVELDSSVKIGGVVQIAPGVLVNAFAIQIGKSLPPAPNTAGIYVVAGVRHVGNTRGDEWYTEIQGVTPRFFQNFLTASSPIH